MKKVRIRVPSGRTVFKRKREKYGVVRCANCKKPLHGVSKAFNIKKVSKSDKRPNRLYGGHLCSSCTKEILREKARTI